MRHLKTVPFENAGAGPLVSPKTTLFFPSVPMPELSGSEISGFLEEELEDYVSDCILVKWPHSGQ